MCIRDRLTLNDWIDTGVHGVFTGITPTFEQKFSPDVELSVAETPSYENAVEAKIQGEKTDWFKIAGVKLPKLGSQRFFGYFVPPAADDYHGLVSKLKGIVSPKAVKKVTDNFIKNHHRYVELSLIHI